ncbi:MAG TPA: hypothetical protein VNM92_06080 [Thermoanaerobaculia bacterium]|nr:hypothetical protein [Thermoanaerobaculia bacterium]
MSLKIAFRFAALIFGAAVGTAAGAGQRATLERDGVRVTGGEVCRFAAADGENPFQRWLSSQEVVCVDAGAAIDIPSGLWNVFAREGGSSLSSQLLVDGDAAPAQITLTLNQAATLVSSLPQGHTAVAYVPALNSAFPVAASADSVTVPAGEPLWLCVLRKSKLVALLPIAAIAPGTELRVDARSAGPPSIIGWLQISEGDRAAIRNARGVTLPAVRASGGGPWRESDPLPSLPSVNGSFFRVRDVPAGDVDLNLEGRGWVPNRRRLKVEDGLTVVEQPLIARPAGTLIVNWSTPDDLPALDRLLGSCADDRRPRTIEISIAACERGRRPSELSESSACTVFRTDTFEPHLTFGALRIDDLASGSYRVEMRFGKLPPIAAIGFVRPLGVAWLPLLAQYDEVAGAVTMGGEPLGEDVTIQFPGGYGFASRDSSEYQAVVSRLLAPDSQINVASCDGTPREVVVTDQPMKRGGRFDIDIPANELTIAVRDTFTREALNGAAVRYGVMSLLIPKRELFHRDLKAGSDDRASGQVVIPAIPEREIRLSVTHPGYQRQAIEAFTMTRREKRRIDVQLVPLRGNRAKIVSQAPFENGAVFWFSTAGLETERVELASDGTFVWTRDHRPDETMSVVSVSHPLWILHAPTPAGKEEMRMRFPDGSGQKFDVVLGGVDRTTTRFIGIVIGGVRAPQPALRHHQQLRGLPPPVARGELPTKIGGLAETGPIELLTGPDPDSVSSRALAIDFFALDAFKNAPRQRVPAGAISISLFLK